MTTTQAFDQISKMIPHLADILNDTDVSDLVKQMREAKGDLPAGTAMKQLMPLFLDRYRENLFRIVAVVDGKEVEAVRSQPIMDTIRSLQGMLLDETLMLFMVFMRMIRTI